MNARLEPHWHARTCFRRMRVETMDMTCSCGLDDAVAALGQSSDWCRYAIGSESCGWPPSSKMHGSGPDQHPFLAAQPAAPEAEPERCGGCGADRSQWHDRSIESGATEPHPFTPAPRLTTTEAVLLVALLVLVGIVSGWVIGAKTR